MSKFKKSILIISAVIIVFSLALSPLAKYLIEKYDEKYTGRQVEMDWAYVNPFTGYIYLSNAKIYELKSDTVFLEAKGISANFCLFKMFVKTYEISELYLDQPKGIIIQTKKVLNFNDIIDRFFTRNRSGKQRKPVHFNILSIKIKDGEFHYQEKLIPINYFIKKVNIQCSGKLWNADTLEAKFSFLAGIGNGSMKGDFTINCANLKYRLGVVAQKYDMNIIGQYLKGFSNYGNFTANIDANIKSNGNFRDPEDVTNSGLLSINDLHFGKTVNDDYTSFDKITLSIREMSPKKNIYFYDSVSLVKPYLKYERYDHLDNVQTMFGKHGSNVSAANSDAARFNLVIEIANYIRVISKNFFKSNYKINRVAIYNGHLKYNDYSISEKFSADLAPLYISADTIDKDHSRVFASLKSGLQPYGDLNVSLSINPNNDDDFDMKYHLQKIPTALFNPYTITFTSFPFDRGTLELEGAWHVRNGMIQSNNHLLVIDPRLTSRLRNKDIKWMPMRMIMSFIRERGNVIDYEIPITGNLKHPKFCLGDAITDVLGNIFVKPATTPYRMDVKNIEREIEKTLTLKWDMRQSSLSSNQENFMEKMVEFLSENPRASVAVYPLNYDVKEKEYILFYEAKKKYFLQSNKKSKRSFNQSDSNAVENMSVKDSLFINYLNKKATGDMLFTIQDKCNLIIDSSVVNTKFSNLKRERARVFASYFKNTKVQSQLTMHASENTVPYNGFSFYRIEYKGELPASLQRAYRRMNELNDSRPRNKFKEDRKSNKRSEKR